MFSHYERLVHKVDDRLATLSGLACPAHCDDCCRVALTVFPVEAFYLRAAFLRLPAADRRLLAGRGEHPDSEACLLLVDQRCILYPYRPILCRTYGHPFLGRGDAQRQGWQIFPGCERAGSGCLPPALGAGAGMSIPSRLTAYGQHGSTLPDPSGSDLRCQELAEQKKSTCVSALPIDPINELLVAVNRLFLEETGPHDADPPLRIPIAAIPSLAPPGMPMKAPHATL